MDQISSSTYRVLNYIIQYKRAAGGVSPTIREICKGCAFHSTSQGRYHLLRLQELGLIERDPQRSRSIHLIGEQWFPYGEGFDA